MYVFWSPEDISHEEGVGKLFPSRRVRVCFALGKGGVGVDIGASCSSQLFRGVTECLIIRDCTRTLGYPTLDTAQCSPVFNNSSDRRASKDMCLSTCLVDP